MYVHTMYSGGICTVPDNDSAHYIVDDATHSPQLLIPGLLNDPLQILSVEHLHNTQHHHYMLYSIISQHNIILLDSTV